MTSRLLSLGLAVAGMVWIGGGAPTSALAQDGSGTGANAGPQRPPCFGTHHPAAFCPRCLPVPPAFQPTCGCPDAEHSLVCFLAHLIRKEREHLMGGSPKGPGAKKGKPGDGDKDDDDKDKDDEKDDDQGDKDDQKDDGKGKGNGGGNGNGNGNGPPAPPPGAGPGGPAGPPPPPPPPPSGSSGST